MSTEISGLVALTSPASGDLLPIVDISDTTQAPTGSTKKITFSNFSAGITALEAIAFTGAQTIEFAPTSGQALQINYPQSTTNLSVMRLHNGLTDLDLGYDGSENSQIQSSRTLN